MRTKLLNSFSMTARKALSNALYEAELEKSPTITIHHLLIGLARLPIDTSTASHILNGFEITAEKLGGIGAVQNSSASQPNLGEDVQKTVERAAVIAKQRGDQVIASAHLLAGGLVDPKMIQILEPFGVRKERLSEALDSLYIWTNEP